LPIFFDKREIPPGANGEQAGAIFALPEPAGKDAEFSTKGAAQVFIGEHSRGVVVTGLEASDAETAWRKGLVVAQ